MRMEIIGKTIAGITIPDSKIAREATELLREHGTALLFNHSLRVFLFAALYARENRIHYDTELFYVSSVFHDLGLMPHYTSKDRRFEVDSADAARDFLRGHGLPSQSLQLVWDAVALHTSPGIAEYKEPEVALLNYATALDVIGKNYDLLPIRHREEIVKHLPRRGLKNEIIKVFFDGFKHKPHTTYGNINQDICACMMPSFEKKDYCDLILHSPWSE